jgi:hypothetical protein
MYYTEEDVQPAVEMTEKLFGVNGNVSHVKGALLNVSIATREFGKLWYGDIEMDHADILNKLHELSKTLEQRVFILAEDLFDFNNPKLSVHVLTTP